MPGSALCVRVNSCAPLSEVPKTQPFTVSVNPTFFRAEITGSKDLLAAWGVPPVCRPALTIHDHLAHHEHVCSSCPS